MLHEKFAEPPFSTHEFQVRRHNFFQTDGVFATRSPLFRSQRDAVRVSPLSLNLPSHARVP
jgi:hypothetical protein